jgi:phosphopantothenoylcysteine decarboxylase/phosphopantothenate--cysteine ligase
LGNVILATTSPIVIAPAMHTEMWQNAATTANVSTLQQRGVFVIDPAVGRLTGSDTGVGRLPDAAEIVTTALNCVVEKDLAGKRILVVAGGTIEPIDPVRFIGNKSSGKQGIALVEEALSRGAEVTLIAANFSYTNRNAVICAVSSTAELLTELNNCVWNFDAVVMPAAVSDFRVASPSEVKLKKSGHDLELSLVENPDVISHIASLNKSTEVLVIGFAAETASGSELVQLAQEKLKRKQLDYIVANDVSGGAGFDSDENTVYICDQLNSMQISGSKRLIAAKILDLLAK